MRCVLQNLAVEIIRVKIREKLAATTFLVRAIACDGVHVHVVRFDYTMCALYVYVPIRDCV